MNILIIHSPSIYRIVCLGHALSYLENNEVVPFFKELASKSLPSLPLFLCRGAGIFNLRPMDFRGNICVYTCFLQKVSLVFIRFSKAEDCCPRWLLLLRRFWKELEAALALTIFLLAPPFHMASLPTQLCCSDAVWSINSKQSLRFTVYSTCSLFCMWLVQVCDFSLKGKIKIDLEFTLNCTALHLWPCPW